MSYKLHSSRPAKTCSSSISHSSPRPSIRRPKSYRSPPAKICVRAHLFLQPTAAQTRAYELPVYLEAHPAKHVLPHLPYTTVYITLSHPRGITLSHPPGITLSHPLGEAFQARLIDNQEGGNTERYVFGKLSARCFQPRPFRNRHHFNCGDIERGKSAQGCATYTNHRIRVCSPCIGHPLPS